MTPASPAPPPDAPGKSHVALEASEIDEATDTVTEAMIAIARDGEPDPDMAEQILLMTPAEMHAVYQRLGTYYAHGIWTEGTVAETPAAPPAGGRAQEAATPLGIPLRIHIATCPPGCTEVHAYAASTEGALLFAEAYARQRDALAAENERLRAALREIRERCDQVTLSWEERVRFIREDAEYALEARDA